MSADCDRVLSKEVVIYLPIDTDNRGIHFFVTDEDNVLFPDLWRTSGQRASEDRLVVRRIKCPPHMAVVHGYVFSRMTKDVSYAMASAAARGLDDDLAWLERILGCKGDAYMALSRAKTDERHQKHHAHVLTGANMACWESRFALNCHGRLERPFIRRVHWRVPLEGDSGAAASPGACHAPKLNGVIIEGHYADGMDTLEVISDKEEEQEPRFLESTTWNFLFPRSLHGRLMRPSVPRGHLETIDDEEEEPCAGYASSEAGPGGFGSKCSQWGLMDSTVIISDEASPENSEAEGYPGNGSANLDSWGRVVMTGFERAQDTLCTGNDALNDEIAFIQWDIDNYLRDAYHSKDDKDKSVDVATTRQVVASGMVKLHSWPTWPDSDCWGQAGSDSSDEETYSGTGSVNHELGGKNATIVSMRPSGT